MKVLDRLSSLSTTQIRVVGIVSIVLVGFVDEVTGVAMSFTLLYLIPIVLLSWYDGRASGIFAAAIATGFSFMADFDYDGDVDSAVVLWNAVSRFLIFIAVAWMLDTLREMQRVRLQAEIDRYTRIVETTIEGIIVLDAHGRVKYSNARAAHLLGMTVKEMSGQHVGRFITDKPSLNKIESLIGKSSGNERELNEIEFTRADGNAVVSITKAD